MPNSPQPASDAGFVAPAAAVGELIGRAIVDAFGDAHADAPPVLRPSTHADYQANGALPLAKIVGQKPREVADAIVANLDLDGIATVEIAGPGFLNITLDDAYLASAVTALVADSRLGVPTPATLETVVADYSSPTVTKEMHVGHLRTTIIGDALVRTLDFVGHRTVRQNHYGDWGTSFGMLIEHLDGARTRGEVSLDDLNEFYRAANDRFTTDADFATRARSRVVALQSGDANTLAMWREFVSEAHRHNVAVYDRLGVLLTDEDLRPESAYNDTLEEVAADLEQSGVAVVDQGALCVFIEGYEAPLIIRKSDGGYTYGTTDLAAVRYRVDALGATRLLYVVDARQSQHLTQVFRAAERAGWLAPPARAEHVVFGSVLDASGRPLKSRSGDSPKLTDLLDEAVERAAAIVAEKNPDLPEAERAAVARAVGIGAIKYSDLSNDRVKDYVFDFARMLAFEGNTGPYLQYAHARIRSLFRRAEVDAVVSLDAAVTISEPAERALALTLFGFGDAVLAVADASAPHKLCTYLFDVAQAFTTFYEACPVLRAESDERRASRLVLCAATAAILERGLSLLGIEAPPRM
ncbi:MAG TPA: arginine--tRNA ligase [Acidimicrobiales bacterium]|nr:arginine--tRNA ligase [Acidimicrobiales bacterium]